MCKIDPTDDSYLASQALEDVREEAFRTRERIRLQHEKEMLFVGISFGLCFTVMLLAAVIPIVRWLIG